MYYAQHLCNENNETSNVQIQYGGNLITYIDCSTPNFSFTKRKKTPTHSERSRGMSEPARPCRRRNHHHRHRGSRG